jgi:hypothetical protein
MFDIPLTKSMLQSSAIKLGETTWPYRRCFRADLATLSTMAVSSKESDGLLHTFYAAYMPQTPVIGSRFGNVGPATSAL